ncbi:ATP-dependent DNA helicase [Trichonephila clavipes]|nr:ATP-dependent DNA helicase [Trichonephila clavipes]
MDFYYDIREIDIGQSSIGDICAVHCVLDDGTNIIMVVVYISPNNTVNNVIKFLYKRLMIYGQVGSEEFEENYHALPLILAGDFSVNFTSEDGQLLVTIGIAFQASITAEVSACSEDGGFGWLRNLRSNSSQRCSMGFR